MLGRSISRSGVSSGGNEEGNVSCLKLVSLAYESGMLGGRWFLTFLLVAILVSSCGLNDVSANLPPLDALNDTRLARKVSFFLASVHVVSGEGAVQGRNKVNSMWRMEISEEGSRHDHGEHFQDWRVEMAIAWS